MKSIDFITLDQNTQMRWFQTTEQHIARNPIARAVAKKRLRSSMIDACIKFYLTPNGDKLVEDVDATATVLATAQEILLARQEEDPVIKGAMSVCQECAQRSFLWQQKYAVTLDVALQRAMSIYMTAPAIEVQNAFQKINSIRDQVRAEHA